MISKIMYFGATWCGQCQVVKRNLEKITDVSVEKYDVDESEATAELFNIKSVPTLIFMDENGESKETLHGAVTLQTIQETIAKHKC